MRSAPRPADTDTLSLHDALPISASSIRNALRRDTSAMPRIVVATPKPRVASPAQSESNGTSTESDRRHASWDHGESREHPKTDRKSTRLNSSHGYISYAVFCLKK